MEFKNVAMLKKYHKERTENYQTSYVDLQQETIKFEFGTKKLTVTVGDHSRFSNGEIMQLSASLTTTVNGVMFVHVSFKDRGRFFGEYYVEEKYENMSKSLFTFMVETWMDYKQFKLLKGVVFGFGGNAKLEAYFNELFCEMKMDDYSYCKNLVRVNKNLFNTVYGKIDEQTGKEFVLIREFSEKLNEMVQSDPSIALLYEGDRILANTTLPFLISANWYRYQKEEFWLDIQEGKIVYHGNDLGEKEFPLNAGSVTEILSMVYEEKRMENLFHPPVENIKNIYKKFFHVFPSDEELERVIQMSDDKIGSGETEKELYYVLDTFYAGDRNGYEIGRKKTVLHLTSDVYFIYRVQTANYFWFFLARKETEEVRIESSKEQYLPTALSELINEWTHDVFNE